MSARIVLSLKLAEPTVSVPFALLPPPPPQAPATNTMLSTATPTAPPRCKRMGLSFCRRDGDGARFGASDRVGSRRGPREHPILMPVDGPLAHRRPGQHPLEEREAELGEQGQHRDQHGSGE